MKNQKFTHIYMDYRNLIMKVVVKRSGNFSLAEEISQQIFTSFYQKMDFIEDAFIKPWLMLAAKNAVIDYLRKKNIRDETFASEYLGRFDVVAEDNTERIVERMANAQLSFRILEDLRNTNESWYNVIEAVCVQELAQDEAAKYLQITPQVLRAKLYRARKYIRAKYAEEYKEF